MNEWIASTTRKVNLCLYQTLGSSFLFSRSSFPTLRSNPWIFRFDPNWSFGKAINNSQEISDQASSKSPRFTNLLAIYKHCFEPSNGHKLSPYYDVMVLERIFQNSFKKWLQVLTMAITGKTIAMVSFTMGKVDFEFQPCSGCSHGCKLRAWLKVWLLFFH